MESLTGGAAYAAGMATAAVRQQYADERGRRDDGGDGRCA